MRRKIITPIVVAALIFGALFYAASFPPAHSQLGKPWRTS